METRTGFLVSLGDRRTKPAIAIHPRILSTLYLLTIKKAAINDAKIPNSIAISRSLIYFFLILWLMKIYMFNNV